MLLNATGFFRKFRKSGRGESGILDFKLKIKGKVGGKRKVVADLRLRVMFDLQVCMENVFFNYIHKERRTF